MSNEADNLLTVTGPEDRVADLLTAFAGAGQLIDFTGLLPAAPVDARGKEPSWWLANAADSSIEVREPGKVALYFRSV